MTRNETLKSAKRLGLDDTTVDPQAWLDGYHAYKAGKACPTTCDARLGWIAAPRRKDIRARIEATR